MKTANQVALNERLRGEAAWKLLAATNAPITIAMLRAHLFDKERRLPSSILNERINRDLEALRAEGREMPQSAQAYLSQWLADGFLERTYEPGASEEVYELSAGAIRAIRFDNLVLVGVRDGGERVPVGGMSTGTVDQLYLALRLAAIERYLETSEPIPLIADDVLIQFDGPRSAATLKNLESLSKKTQVLLFTHHEHVRDLARQYVDPAALVLHELVPQTSA